MSETPAPLRAAVVGLGSAGETHLKAYNALPGVHVVAIADANAERLEKVRAEHKVQYAYADWQELIERERHLPWSASPRPTICICPWPWPRCDWASTSCRRSRWRATPPKP
jgi:hypothetical protein